MLIGILQFELFIDDARSLKDKRRVMSSLKDRLHREHLCSIAEVGDADALNHALLGLAIVGRDGGRIGETLDRITAKLRGLTEAEVGDIRRQILAGEDVGPALGDDADALGAEDPALRDELLRRANDGPEERA
jgi:hypothetical protein